MKPGAAAAAAALQSYVSVTAAPTAVTDLLVNIIISSGWSDNTTADEQAESWADGFKARVTMAINDARDAGRFIPYAFNSASDDHIQGACYCEPLDTPDVKAAKGKRASVFQIAGSLNNFTPDDFEIACKNVLRLFGVHQPQSSQRSADGGVDFYGQAPFSEILAPIDLPPGVEKDLKVWFIGQAKQYPISKISTNEIRELVGSAELARSKIFAGKKDPLALLTARLCDPIFYILITTSDFTRDSREIILKSGVIGMDGMQLAQFLADHGKGISTGIFVEDEFRSWALG
ncbi:MAG: restriction endonuclease [Caulobacteraceae bacterium]|nr:restriction endonuclease [Caulobacteraceae bacterium]